MSRQARYDYPGAYHHVMSRGFKKEILFANNNEYNYYLDCLAEFSKYGYKILEYALLPNHVHLLIRTGEITLQKILKSINTRYALFKNKKRGLPGPVFQGRPKSLLITSEGHLKTVARYILRNPLKAGLCCNLYEYKWCSYRYLEQIEAPNWYDNQIILSEFSDDKIKAVKDYKEYIRVAFKDNEKEYSAQMLEKPVVGDKIEFEKVLKSLKKDKRIANKTYTRKIDWNKRIKAILKKSGKSIEDLKNDNTSSGVEIKRRIAYIMKELMFCESSEIRKHLKLSKSALSRYVLNIKRKIQEGKVTEGSL